MTITRRALPRYSRRTFSSVRPASSVMTSPPVKAARSLRWAMRRCPKPGARTATASSVPCDGVVHEHPERRAVDLLGQDHQRPRLLHDRVEQRHQVLHRRDRLGRHEDVRVLVDRLHARLVGRHVGRDHAVLDQHALDELDRDAGQRRLLDGDDALLPDVIQRLRDGLADAARPPCRRSWRRGAGRRAPTPAAPGRAGARRRARSPPRCRGAAASGWRPRRSCACPRARSPGPAAWRWSSRRR